MSELAQYEQALVGRLRSIVERRLANLVEAGVPLPPVDDLVEAMAAGLPDGEPHPVALILGPFFSSNGAMRILGVPTRQALASRRAHGSVLALKTADGHWVYPAFQFDHARHRVRPALAEVLKVMRGVDPWVVGLWLVEDHPDLEGHSPLEALPGRVGEVVDLARQYRQDVA